MSYRKKGKCSKGDACPFLHISKDYTESALQISAAKAYLGKDSDRNSSELDNRKGLCRNFVKKGKCRKGDKCKYMHIVTNTKKDTVVASNPVEGCRDEVNITKKRKIDGKFLVERRSKLLATNQEDQ